MRQILFIILFCSTLVNLSEASQDPNYWSKKLFECVHFAPNGNEIIFDIETAEKALKNGADPNWINAKSKHKFNRTSVLNNFVYLEMFNQDPFKKDSCYKIVDLLFKHGAKIQSTDVDILFVPVANGKLKLTELLLKNGVDPKFWSRQIGTKLSPVEYAAKEGFTDIVNLLIKYGSKPIDSENQLQLSFIETARSGTLLELKKLFQTGKVNINTTNKNNNTALISAISDNLNFEYSLKVDFLLKNGALPNQEGQFLSGNYSKPLHIAVYTTAINMKSKRNLKQAQDVLSLLVKHGAYISGRDSQNKTPLHWAAKFNNIHAARLLLENNSKVMPKDNLGNTPFDYAESGEMIRLLKSYGAKE